MSQALKYTWTRPKRKPPRLLAAKSGVVGREVGVFSLAVEGFYGNTKWMVWFCVAVEPLFLEGSNSDPQNSFVRVSGSIAAMVMGLSNIRRPLTWMLLCIYGLLFSAGDALHLVPGFEHSHGPVPCSHEHPMLSSTDNHATASSSHTCCHHHDHDSKLEQNLEQGPEKVPVQWESHHDCSICKWLAVPIVLTTTACVPSAGDAVNPWVALYAPLAFLEPVSIESVRGPPSLI